MGDEELAQLVSNEFLSDIPRQIEALKSFLDGGDTAGALRQVHSIKGASANVGGEALRALAVETEKAGQEGGLDAIIVRVPDIESQFCRLRAAMSDFAGRVEPKSGEPS
jgi:HPt (histidine-containing phosphotransfer) domain-containing protein